MSERIKLLLQQSEQVTVQVKRLLVKTGMCW